MLTRIERLQARSKRRWSNLRYRQKHGGVDDLAPEWDALRELKVRFYEVTEDCDPLAVRRGWRRIRKEALATLPPDLEMVERGIRNLERCLARRRKTLWKKHLSRLNPNLNLTEHINANVAFMRDVLKAALSEKTPALRRVKRSGSIFQPSK
jgi:hypothetical protein